MSSSYVQLFMLCLTAAMFSVTSISAQDRSKRDTSVIILEEDDLFDLGPDMNLKLDLGKPHMTLWGGQSMLSRDGMTIDIEDALSFGVVLGTERIRTPKNSSSIRHIRTNGVYVWHGLVPDSAATDRATLGLWRFGTQSITGYGYAFGTDDSGIYFTSGTNGGWSVLNITSTPTTPSDAAYLTHFGADLRYGESMHAGISVRPSNAVAVNVGYEWNQVYPRHLFWYWLMSQGIEGIADGVATTFVKAVGKSSPDAVPVLHFLLRNGIAAGFKALRATQMNWPFDTVAPLNVHTFTIGATITF